LRAIWFDVGKLLGENRSDSIGIVRGESGHPKITTEPDISRLIDRPDVNLMFSL
jgi:hypothetical protein